MEASQSKQQEVTLLKNPGKEWNLIVKNFEKIKTIKEIIKLMNFNEELEIHIKEEILQLE